MLTLIILLSIVGALQILIVNFCYKEGFKTGKLIGEINAIGKMNDRLGKIILEEEASVIELRVENIIQ